MADELTMCAAAFFRGIGKDVTTPDEFVMGTSLEMKWMSPSDAKLLLAALVRAGILAQKDGYVRPAADLGAVDVPLAYRPPQDLVEALHRKSQTPKAEAPSKPEGKSPDQPADPFAAMMEAAVGMGMQRRDFVQSCNAIQKRLDVEIGVAALIVLRDAGADISPFAEAVYDYVRLG